MKVILFDFSVVGRNQNNYSSITFDMCRIQLLRLDCCENFVDIMSIDHGVWLPGHDRKCGYTKWAEVEPKFPSSIYPQG